MTLRRGPAGGCLFGWPAASDSIFDNRIRVVAAATGTFYGQAMTAGDIYTVAGGGKGRVEGSGPATGARLLRPQGVAAGPRAAS